jgi:probable F420-dependent oxidoreductase
MTMRLAITLGQLNPALFEEATIVADELGYESVWLPEHLVFPKEIRGQLVPGEEHPPVPPTVPVFDAPAYLAYLAGKTAQIRLGTFVYLLGLRHPFIGARAFATLDVVSGGRALCGVGAGWLETEWEAVGLDPRTRGRRLDEAIAVCRRLWSEPEIAHRGELYEFDTVCFEPKPVQSPFPVHVGGESRRALQRAATNGVGWIGMSHTPESAAARIATLRGMVEDAGRDPSAVEVTVMATSTERDAIAAYERAGVDRLIVVPWSRSREAVDGLRRFAAEWL